MSYHFEVQPSGRLVLVVFEGEISPEEERQAVLDFAVHPGVDMSADILVDRSRATIQIPASQVASHVHLVKETFPARERQPRMAILAPGDLDFGMARMLELTGGDDLPHKIMVVRTLADACTWLGVAESALVWPQ